MLNPVYFLEQLLVDRPKVSLKRVEMRSKPGYEIAAAVPGEFDGERSGPLFFPDIRDEETFKKKFAEAQVLPLSSSSFKKVNGVYSLQIRRTGISTRSCYAFSLPRYAVPLRITVQDLRSAELLNKDVIRDDKRRCYVIYIECRPVSHTFDFRVDIEFRIEKKPGVFGNSEYRDDHVPCAGHETVVPTSLRLRDLESPPEHLSARAVVSQLFPHLRSVIKNARYYVIEAQKKNHHPSANEISETFSLLADAPGPQIDKYVLRGEGGTPYSAALEIIQNVLGVSFETVKRYIRPMPKTKRLGRSATSVERDA